MEPKAVNQGVCWAKLLSPQGVMELTGKGAFLTGGAMGIGLAVLQALLERGARVSAVRH